MGLPANRIRNRSRFPPTLHPRFRASVRFRISEIQNFTRTVRGGVAWGGSRGGKRKEKKVEVRGVRPSGARWKLDPVRKSLFNSILMARSRGNSCIRDILSLYTPSDPTRASRPSVRPFGDPRRLLSRVLSNDESILTTFPATAGHYGSSKRPPSV